MESGNFMELMSVSLGMTADQTFSYRRIDGQLRATLGGIVLEGVRFSESNEGKVTSIYIDNVNLYEYIINTNIRDFSELSHFSFAYPYLLSDDMDEFYIMEISVIRYNDSLAIDFDFYFAIDKWKHPWSMVEHGNLFISNYQSIDMDGGTLPTVEEWDGSLSDLRLMIEGIPLDSGETIKSLISNSIAKAEIANVMTINQKNHRRSDNKILEIFEFPESVRTSCEQYLIYFAEFLKDIGQNVNVGIEHSGSQTLFSISPDNKEQAIDKIYQALKIYLQLPASMDSFSKSISFQSIEIQKLQSNIGFLNAQLGLARATMLQQSIAITQRDEIIQQQNKQIENSILMGRILTDSLKDKGETEPVLKGVLNMKKYEVGPLEIDLPNLFRQLKAIFQK